MLRRASSVERRAWKKGRLSVSEGCLRTRYLYTVGRWRSTGPSQCSSGEGTEGKGGQGRTVRTVRIVAWRLSWFVVVSTTCLGLLGPNIFAENWHPL